MASKTEFKSILYIPDTQSDEFYERNKKNEIEGAKLKLFVRRVFITDTFTALIPRYLSFVIGVVDSDTLPLNVSRETLQEDASMKTIRKKLIRKALDMIYQISISGKCRVEGTEDMEIMRNEEGQIVNHQGIPVEVDENGDPLEIMKECDQMEYDYFYDQYGLLLKDGFLEDAHNRSKILDLLRYKTSDSKGKYVSLEEVVMKSPEDMEYIYYHADPTLANFESNPAVEALMEAGYPVLFAPDPVDEWIFTSGIDFLGMRFQNVASEGLRIGARTHGDDLMREYKALKKKNKPFLNWWKSVLTEANVHNIDDVRVSQRLVTSPATVVNKKGTLSANMDQNLAHMETGYVAGENVVKILEINLKHPMIKKLKEAFMAQKDGEETSFNLEDFAVNLYYTADIQSGFIFDKQEYTKSVYNILGSLIGVSKDSPVDKDHDLTADEIDELVPPKPESVKKEDIPEDEIILDKSEESYFQSLSNMHLNNKKDPTDLDDHLSEM